MSIIGTLPNTISNGDPLDATPVMADFNWIVAQVNGNAAPLASPTFSGTVTMTGNLAVSSGITVGGGSSWSAYAVGTYTGTATGLTTSPTASIEYTLNGNMVTLDIPALGGTSNSANFTITGAPSAIRPVGGSKIFLVRVVDNSAAAVVGLGQMDTGGTITLGVSPAAVAGFTGSGTKQIQTCSVCYTLQ